MTDLISQGNLRAGHVVRPSLVDEIVGELRGLVLSGGLGPGERIVEERLTERLGVSRAPLREALRILERDGLVSRRPRRGVVVARLTADDVREIYSLRWALERLAVRLGVPVHDPERLVALRAALEKMRAAVESDRLDEVVKANSAFHIALVNLPGHTRLLQAYRTLAMQLEMCMAVNLRFRAQQYPDTQDPVCRHERLLQLIEAGDREAVMHEIGAHGETAFMEHMEDLMDQEE